MGEARFTLTRHATMNDLEQELFGCTDSDSDSELDMNSHQPVDNMDLNDDSDAFDPIFQSIMNSHEEEQEQQQSHHHLHYRSVQQQSSANPSTIITNALTLASTTAINNSPPRPNHLPHEQVEGLCLHTNVLSDKDQARLMAQITEKNFFKAGQQNQAMCFGQRDLEWLTWLIYGRLFSDSEDGHGGEIGGRGEGAREGSSVLSEPYCSSSWTTRAPLFDQSIMNLYFPGKATPLFDCFFCPLCRWLRFSIETIMHCSLTPPHCTFCSFLPTFHRQWDKTTRGPCAVKLSLFSQIGAFVADGTSDAHLALFVLSPVLSLMSSSLPLASPTCDLTAPVTP